MGDILGKYPVLYMDRQIGTLSVERKGLMTIFSCICSMVSSSVLRLYCVCDGSPVMIGVMLPCSKNLTLSKTFSKNDLQRMGLGNIDYAVLAPNPDFLSDSSTKSKNQPDGNSSPATWAPEPQPWRLFADEDIIASCKQIKGALTKFEKDTAYLAVPINTKEPFPPMPIFCFGTLEKINGSDYIVFTMKDGKFI